MIDLKSVVEKYPECLDSATKFKSYMMDLYPDNSNKACIRILADIIDCGIALEIENGKTDNISISNFCNTMESQYGYSAKLVGECINQFLVAFGFTINETTNKVQPKTNATNSSKGRMSRSVCITSSTREVVDYICKPRDFSIKKGELIKYKGHDANVAIPDNVISIATNAFNGCRNLLNIIIPDSVVYIGKWAFNGIPISSSNNYEKGVLYISNHLIDVNNSVAKNYRIKNGTRSIADDAFFGCKSLLSVAIPKSIINIGKNAFWGCSNLENITIQNGVKRIGEKAFYECKKLISIKIPNGVSNIEKFTFYRCTHLKSVNIPCSITSIDEEAFSGCIFLENITLPNSVTSIGKKAFSGCNSLEDIIIPGTVTNIGVEAFNDCDNLKNATIQNGVTNISEKMFYRCGNLKNATLPNSITSIGKFAFGDCYFLESITLPDSLMSIGEYAFSSCCRLRSITIPNNITRIAKTAFAFCDYLKVYFQSEEQKNKFADCFGPKAELIVKAE